MSPSIHMAFQGHTLTGLVWPSIGSIHFRCGSHLTKFFPLSTPAVFIKLCCLSSAVLYISVNVPLNICLCVCLNLHPPADTFSFLYFYELCTHMPSWTHVILICLDITFIIFSHIRQIVAISKFFSLSRSCSTGSDVLGLFFGAKVFHINYLVASTSVHSNAVHINMTFCYCMFVDAFFPSFHQICIS